MSVEADVADLRKEISTVSQRLKLYANYIEITPEKFTPADVAEVLRLTVGLLEVFDKVLADAEMEI